MEANNKKPACYFGENCYRQNKEHLEKYEHPMRNIEEGHTPSTNCSKKKVLKQAKLNFSREQRNPSISPDIKRKPGRQSGERENSDVEHIEKKNKRRKISGNSDDGRKSISVNEEDDDGPITDVTSESWTFIGSHDKEESEDDVSNSSDEDAERTHLPFTGKTIEDKMQHLFLVNMPADFYSFFEFCQQINEKNPLNALAKYGWKLVGPFDVLTGDLKPDDVTLDKSLCHWRFFMDPPEMQTIVVLEKGQHYGYWRDEPETENPFIVSNTVPDCRLISIAPNIFAAAIIDLEAYIRKCSPFEKVEASKMLGSIKRWAEDHKFDIEENKNALSHRKPVAVTFNGLGIVVPVDSKTDVGYRPLIETYANIKKMCKAIMNAKNEEDQGTLMEPLDRLINAANIANDECDFGNGLELGMNLFCMGSSIFHKKVQHLLTNAYNLLNRSTWAEVIAAHLKWRRTGLNLSALQK